MLSEIKLPLNTSERPTQVIGQSTKLYTIAVVLDKSINVKTMLHHYHYFHLPLNTLKP